MFIEPRCAPAPLRAFGLQLDRDESRTAAAAIEIASCETRCCGLNCWYSRVTWHYCLSLGIGRSRSAEMEPTQRRLRRGRWIRRRSSWRPGLAHEDPDNERERRAYATGRRRWDEIDGRGGGLVQVSSEAALARVVSCLGVIAAPHAHHTLNPCKPCVPARFDVDASRSQALRARRRRYARVRRATPSATCTPPAPSCTTPSPRRSRRSTRRPSGRRAPSVPTPRGRWSG